MIRKLKDCRLMRPVVRYLRDSIIVLSCLAAFLWLAKCPGDLEWWRPVCMGALLPIMKRFL
jgi:hypothetical protein